MRKPAYLPFGIACRQRQRADLLRQIDGPDEGMEVAMFLWIALLGRMRVIVIERLSLRIEHLARRVVIPFEEGLVSKQFTHDGIAGLGENGFAFGNLAAGSSHPLEIAPRKAPEIDGCGAPRLQTGGSAAS